MLTVTFILVIGALIAAIAAAMNKCPLWVAVVLLAIAQAINVLPIR